MFDYSKEPTRDILCIDCKSFYASVECVERGLNPLKTMLVVMSNAENAGGLVLAASPLAKKVLGISNVTRKNEVPDHPDLLVVPPRMNLYMKKYYEINQIYRNFVANEDQHTYSVDESFLDVTQSLSYFHCQKAQELARLIQLEVKNKTGIYITVGIGDNPLLAKLALDNEAKSSKNFIAEWRYKDVPNKVWTIADMTDFWGIGGRTAKRLRMFGIQTIYDLAHTDYQKLKDRLGIIGEQLYAHSWGIDRSFLGDLHIAKEKSIGNSQILPSDYTSKGQIEIVLKEIVEQVTMRLRRMNTKTENISIYLGYPKNYIDQDGKRQANKQMKIPLTNNSKELKSFAMQLFTQIYFGQEVRSIGFSCGKLSTTDNLQLNLFLDPTAQIADDRLDLLIDTIRRKYGFKSIVHATSLLEGATAIKRANLVGGHAGGNEGLS